MDDELRRKRVKPVIFHENGTLRNIPLQEMIEVSTAAGKCPAELITCYADGSIHRIFPLDGHMTGFWSEEDEYELAREFEISGPLGTIKQKVVGIQFFPNGAIKSLTFWPKDRVTILSPIGEVKVRIGLALYPDGKVRSFEPSQPISVNTPLGKINAYSTTALGVHGEVNSLGFTEEGSIEKLATSTNKVIVLGKEGNQKIYQPELKPGMFNLDAIDVFPLEIEFYENKVRFNKSDEDEYLLDKHSFRIEGFRFENPAGCSSCNDCQACG